MSKLYDKAIRLLANREHSVQELKRKLSASGTPEELDALLHELKENNLQSDERYAEAYVRMRAGRGYGPKRIKIELAQRGVSSSLAQAAINDADVNWDDIEQYAYEKKFGGKPLLDYKDKQKRLKYLFDKGFSAKVLPGEYIQDE